MSVASPSTQGIGYLTDSEGRKKAVVIDLALYGDMLEEFFDVVVARQRIAEGDTISSEQLRNELRVEGRLDADV